MRRILYLLYQPYKWLVLVPFFALSTLFFGFLAVALAALVSPRFGSAVCGTAWARANAFLTPMRVTVVGRERFDPERSYVVIANHQSSYDIYVLYGWLRMDFKWVLKQELRRVPGLGIGCEKLGHIFVDRSNTEAAVRSINSAKERLKDGTSVVFFPEGTRGEHGRLLPFKKGAFRMALDLGLPILPVTLLGTPEILPPNTLNLFPGRAKLVFHHPIEIDGYRRKSLETLIRDARAAVASGLPRAEGPGASGGQRSGAAAHQPLEGRHRQEPYHELL